MLPNNDPLNQQSQRIILINTRREQTVPNYTYDHIHLISADPEKAAGFYEQAFGAKRVDTRAHPDGATSVILSLPGTKLLITSAKTGEVRSPADPPRKHLGLEHWGLITDNLEETAKHLKSMGVEFVQEVTKYPGLSLCYIKAPDNVLVEIMQRM
jgi:catechol 2,3-dioxygenase-like lactoylglutathione lyase family enzyme